MTRWIGWDLSISSQTPSVPDFVPPVPYELSPPGQKYALKAIITKGFLLNAGTA